MGRTGEVGVSHPHESAALHVSGQATYTDDTPELAGTLHAALGLSPVAHGWLRAVDVAGLRALPGVVEVLTAADIPGTNDCGPIVHDDPVLAPIVPDAPEPRGSVQYLGQPLFVVVATTREQARRAAARSKDFVRIDPLPAVFDVREAHARGLHLGAPLRLTREESPGATRRAIESAPHRLAGRFSLGGQEQFYLEGHISYAQPGEDGAMRVLCSTQHPSEMQHVVAHVLAQPAHRVLVECRRMGGGFGGKETQAGHLAVWAAVAATKVKQAVKLRLDRDDDFMVTGKRHPFAYEYSAGFDDTGRLTALKVMMAANCGFSADLSGPVADRAIFHTDNAYYLQDVDIASYRCKTNTQSHTAYRGFGGPQGVILIETIMGDIARQLKMDPLDVRMRNLYSDEAIPGTVDKRDTTHYQMKVEDNILEHLLSKLELSAQYRSRVEAISAWNAQSPVLKRGIAITPVKFGISFTATLFNQAGALVHVYTDGSVQVNHGGTEMGQGLHTKISQIVADELGIPFAQVMATASDTSKIPNASATAASAGTDLNGRAAQFAARHVRDNLAAFVGGLDGVGAGAVRFEGGQVTTPKTTRSFTQVVGMAYANRIQLWSDGFYRTPKIHYDKTTLTGRPFYYFAYGAACTEVAIDTLTGESKVLKVDILHDVGRSINPAIDIGQIEGGFVQGMGWLTTEQLVWNDKGYLSTHAPSTYKIPTAGDVPEHFKVSLWPEPNREDNVYGSKAVGEPPFMLGISVYEALRDAVAQARGDGAAVQLVAPATAENVLRALG
jgi:xanthine dehydrogenase large subunit